MDLDYRTGKFVSDATANDIVGPVRQVEVHEYEKGTLASRWRDFFDGQGNRVRQEWFGDVTKTCGVWTHVHDAKGFPVSSTSESGNLAGPNDCRDLGVVQKRSYVNAVDSRGALIAKRWLDESGAVVWEYSFEYDSVGRLIAAAAKSPSGDRWSESYSYSPDTRGTRIVRKSTSRYQNVSSDGTTTVTVSPEGLVLEILESGLDNAQLTYSYLPGGQLTEFRWKFLDASRPDYTVSYSGHDSHGNWTVSITKDSRREDRRSERVIRYY